MGQRASRSTASAAVALRAGVGRRAGRVLGVASAALLLAAGVAGASVPGPLRYTHSVTATVTVSDEWTRSAVPGFCSEQGSGVITAELKWKHPARARVEIEPAAGRWTLLVPGFGHSVLDLGAQAAAGSIAYSANLAQVGECEGAPSAIVTAGCSTYPLAGTANVFGLDRHRLRADASIVVGTHLSPSHGCPIGAFRGFNSAEVFAQPLSVAMPTKAAFARQRVVVLHGTDVGHIHEDLGLGNANLDETVTERATVTFTRLPH